VTIYNQDITNYKQSNIFHISATEVLMETTVVMFTTYYAKLPRGVATNGTLFETSFIEIDHLLYTRILSAFESGRQE
jgi:hypothetical protein